MASERTRGFRRRPVVTAGLAAGVLAGLAVGAALLSHAEPEVTAPTPLVLHAAPAIVDARRPVQLGAATFCTPPGSDACRVTGAQAYVRPFGVIGWTRIAGDAVAGGFRFTVPAALVPTDGFSYWLSFRTATGRSLEYPPGGVRSPVRVVTTAGLPHRSIAGAFSWDALRRADGTVLRLSYGSGTGQVGLFGGPPDQVSGPSSFDVGPDGSIYVVDWVNRRVEVFSPDGGYRREFPTPMDTPMDLAVASDGRTYMSTLGANAKAFELDAEGRVVGRYPVGYGVPAQILATSDGPRVQVAPGQYVAVRAAPGIPLTAERQASLQTTSIPLANGGVGFTDDLDGRRFAAVWTRPDGSRAGAVIALPRGV